MFDTLVRGVREVTDLDPDELSNPELSDALVAIHREKVRLEAAESALTGAWAARQCFRDDGARNPAAWLSTRLGIAKDTASRRVRVARAVRAMPVTAAAWAAGEVSVDHVLALVRARTDRTVECFDRDEKLLVDQAKTGKYTVFASALSYWCQLADPEGVEVKAAEQHGRRRMHLSESLGGWWYGEFGLDALNGAIVNETLSAIYDELFAADWAEAKARVGESVTVADLRRTPEQRRADALVAAFVRARTAPADGRRPAPLFTVLVGYETLAGRVCELAGGTVVTPGSLVPWLDEACIERVVFDGPSRVVDVGVRQRLFTGALRRAIEVRDRVCYHHYCDIRAPRCQIDHEIPYAVGGPTDHDNGRLACDYHNRNRHRRPPPPG